MRPSRFTLAISQEVQVKNNTTYKRRVPSTQWAGGYSTQTVTRKAHNRKRSHAKTTTRRADFTALGIMVGISLGCVYLHYFSDSTLNLIYPSAQAQEVTTPVLTPEHTEGEALAAEAGQQKATPSALLKSEKQQILEYIVEVFGDDADKAIWMARCESGLRANAVNDKNRNGTVDYGVFQINSVHIKRHGDGFTKSWKENVNVAKKIFDEQGFTPWVCAKSVGEKNYLGQ